MTSDRWLGPLGLRLVAAFLLVAVVAVGVLAALTIFASRSEVSGFVDREHHDAATAAAAEVADAFIRAGGWAEADLTAAAAVAAHNQATFVVTDPAGTVIAAPTAELAAMMTRMHGVAAVDVARGHDVTAPVEVNGRRVADVVLSFPTSGLPTAARQVRDAMSRTAVAGTALAAVAALVVALFVASRLTRPLTAVTDAARRLAEGHREVRVGAVGAPGELGELADSFDAMAAALDREDDLRRDLLTDVAHELRTPLTILRGQTEAMADGIMPADPAAVGSLHDEVVRLTRLVGDLETLAAAEAARLRLDLQAVDLADVAAVAVDSVSSTADDAGVRLETALASALTNGDPDRLHQIVLNLLTNAIKFTPPAGTVTVSTVLDGAEARLTVSDTGPGIPSDELEHVFGRFWRGRDTHGTAGSGIGLAVAAELASAHRGTLTATNQPGGGTAFTLTIP